MRLARCLLVGLLCLAGCRARGDFVTAYQPAGEKNVRDQAADLQIAVFKQEANKGDSLSQQEPTQLAGHPPARDEERTVLRPAAPAPVQPVIHWQIPAKADPVRLQQPIPVER